MISWKYTFKRLNEEYEIANKKKQALDKLLESGKISQSTRDSFTNDINAAIVQIEKQQKELIESMQLKTQELENQIKTLEILLANYEIQHVVGEIDEQIYQQEINLLTTGLDTTRNELNVIKQTTNQLCSPIAIQAPAAPEPVAPIIEAKILEPAPIEPTPVEVPVEAAPVETIMETSPVTLAPVESAPAEIPLETVKAEAAPIESAPAEIAPVEVAPAETVSAPIEAAPVEVAPVETPIIEVAPLEVAPVETASVPIETAPVENIPVETAPVEVIPVEAPIAAPEPEVQLINESTPEIAPQEPAIIEPTMQEPVINVEAVAPETVPAVEQPTVEVVTAEIAPTEVPIEVPTEVITEAAPAETTPTEEITQVEIAEVAPTEITIEAEPEQTEVKVPLQDFEIIPETETIETTLEKVMEPLTETINEPAMVEEITVPAHPLEAPQVGQTEAEQSAEAATATEDSSKEESE